MRHGTMPAPATGSDWRRSRCRWDLAADLGMPHLRRRGGSDAAAVDDLVVQLFQLRLVLCLLIGEEDEQLATGPGAVVSASSRYCSMAACSRPRAYRSTAWSSGCRRNPAGGCRSENLWSAAVSRCVPGSARRCRRVRISSPNRSKWRCSSAASSSTSQRMRLLTFGASSR